MINNTPHSGMGVLEYSKSMGVPMTKIIICDDDCLFATKLCHEIRKNLDKIGKSAQIHTFQYIEDIPQRIFAECDIAFLDVDFTDKRYTGMDIARQIRKLQKNAVILFVTNYPEYAPEGYEVQAFRYLLKSEINTKLSRYLSQALQQLAESKRIFQIPVGGDILRLPVDNIIYIEAQLHTVVVHSVKNNNQGSIEYTFYSTLTSVEDQLASLGFLRIHKSYLVNMRHIIKYMCKEAVLSNGVILKVSEKNYSEQKKKYLLWKGRQ